MPAKDLGTKHTCWKCGTKFYDLKKPMPICPKCGADQRESPALKPATAERRSRPPARATPDDHPKVDTEIPEEAEELPEEEVEPEEDDET